MKPTLFLTIGYPGAGKSTFSKQLARELGLVRLNSGINGNGIREYMFENKLDGWPENNSEVYGALRYAAIEVLKAGHSVIFDSSNSSIKDRAPLHELAEKQGASSVVIWMKAPIDTARERADSRDYSEQEEIVPRSHFDKLVDRLEEPKDTELCITIDGTATFEDQLQSFNTQLQEVVNH